MESKKYKLSLFIFRRDFRIADNTALIKALQESEKNIACFILDPRQVTDKNNFKSDNALQFMFEALKNLNQELKNKKSKLYLFYGLPEEIVEKLIISLKIDAVFVNQDYTPFSKQRDQDIQRVCAKHNIDFISTEDILLHEVNSIFTSTNKPYSVFSYYFRKAKSLPIRKIQDNNYKNFYNKSIDFEESFDIFSKFLKNENKNLFASGNRKQALKVLNNLEDFKDYKNTKNYPAKATTGLSAYIKFGLVSIREAYYAMLNSLGESSDLISQLYWHDFYTYIIYHNPHALTEAYQDKYKVLSWSDNKEHFKKWQNGLTGFPIVDAGMRQLNITGFMHNRARLLVSSFLVKDLLINWQWGEKYFAQHEIDYDPSINNGNWQWVASTGVDFQPYFRIFNPWSQQKKYDPNCEYIKTWVPELKSLDDKVIHNWYKYYDKYKLKVNYPKPMVKHDEQAVKAKKLFKI